MPQIAYCTDDEGYYTHSEHCTTDPIESARQGHDMYVLPANGYLDAPVIADGCVAKRVGGAWVDVENHVGEKGYINGVPTEIKEYGSLPEGWSITPPAPTLEDQFAAIEAKYAGKQAELDSALVNALWVEGPQEASIRGALMAKRQKLIDDRDAEIAALFA